MSPWTKKTICVVWAGKHLMEVTGWEHENWHGFLIHKAANDRNFGKKIHTGWVITDMETGRYVARGFTSRTAALAALPDLDKRVVLPLYGTERYRKMADDYRRLLQIRSEVEVKSGR